LFIAITVAAIFLVAVVALILSGIAIHWLKDSHYKDHCECDDGDQCTDDLGLEGGCSYLPRPDGHECNSACFYPEPAQSIFDEHRCQYRQFDELGNWNPRSVCTGTECKGDCDLTSDCPDITFAEGIGGSPTKDCDSDACYYTLDVSDLNNDVDVPCDRSSPAYVQICLSKLNASDPIVADNCLLAEPVCDPEPENELSIDLVQCHYFFRCATPKDNMILVRDVPNVRSAPEGEEESGRQLRRDVQDIDEIRDVDEDVPTLSSPQTATIRGRAKLWKKR
jgi:hypothetical protein